MDASAAALTAVTEVHSVQAVELRGLTRTRENTVLRLLPRQPPARYTQAELREFERRVNNLGIFDSVSVEARPTRLVVDLREKWTLIPMLQLATGSSWRDVAFLVGAIEYNFLGTGNQFALSVFHEQRGWGFSAGFSEHPYQHGRWALGSELTVADVARNFDDASWHTSTIVALLGLTSPRWLSDHLSYSFGGAYVREVVQDATGEPHPESTHSAASQLAFNWDAYQWNDLAPSGYRAQLGAEAGFAAAPSGPIPRNAARFVSDGSLRLSPTTALLARGTAQVSTRGNANYSFVIGSIEGVRGLADGTYHTWADTFVNVELRQSLRLAPRWALQGVVFSDAAAFQLIDAAGDRAGSETALSVGGGVRVVPTWLANVVLRLDVARLVEPEQRWFVQFGLNQYL